MAFSLMAQRRSVTGKGVRELRKKGKIPAVMYGPKQKATAIELTLKDFTTTLAKAGESTLITLSVEGEEHNVLVHDVDRDPITNIPRHADFYAVVKGQEIEVNVPLKFVGEAPAVKELGANLIKALHEIRVKADPTNLPHELTVDVSGLSALGMRIDAKDIQLPKGVTLVTHSDEIIATTIEAMEEKEPESVPDIVAIEISEERGKKPEEEEEEVAAPAGTAGAATAEKEATPAGRKELKQRRSN